MNARGTYNTFTTSYGPQAARKKRLGLVAGTLRLAACLLKLEAYSLKLATYMLLLSLIPFLFSCNPLQQKKKLNKRVTLKRSDKIPYGMYVAYNNLQYMFPVAEVEVNKVSPSSFRSFMADHSYYPTAVTTADDEETVRNKTLYLIITPYFAPNKKEYNAIMEFIGRGNHVFISAQYWGEEFEDSLDMSVANPFLADSVWVSVFNPVQKDSLAFTYPGSANHGYFMHYDTTYASVLGRDNKGEANFIRHTYEGGGSMYIHTAPLALTNFFLLHKKNNTYYNNVLSYLPQSIDRIEWDEYFRYGRQFSAWQVIMNHPGLRAAFWLTLLIFALIFLFDSKRKQRIIPKIPPLRNASLDFVKTIGRLYYQYRDNKNLGMKMSAQLMDHIRSRYNIPTSIMDEGFISNLAHKSGFDIVGVQKMIYQAKMIQDSPRVSDEELMEFHKLTEAFYKHQ